MIPGRIQGTKPTPLKPETLGKKTKNMNKQMAGSEKIRINFGILEPQKSIDQWTLGLSSMFEREGPKADGYG